MTASKIIALTIGGSCLVGATTAQAQRARPLLAQAPKVPARTRAKARVLNTRVVPGVSLGRVALGDAQGVVRKRLGAPATSFKLNNGLSSDLWRADAAKRWDKQPHTFEVVYRRGVAIQIEATNTIFTTARGLGLKSSDAAWERAYGKRDESKQFKYVGGKRDQGYDDWIASGFALEFQFLTSDGAGDPPIQMHTLIVHYKGVPVIPDPGGS